MSRTWHIQGTVLFDLTDLLTIVGLFAAVQFIANSLSNSRDAIRLVPIGSITPSIVRKYKTVPLCFVGGDTVLTSIVTYVYGRFWLRPMARKQVALCDRIVFLNEENMPQPQHTPLKAGMIVQATLSEGEFSPHIRRSTRRCTIGHELVIAILFPAEDGQRFVLRARCITVRARARPAQDMPGRVPSRVVEWEVINPAGIGSDPDVLLNRVDVPKASFWLISQETDSYDDPTHLRFGRVSYAYGSRRIRGLVSLCVTVTAKIAFVILMFRLADLIQVPPGTHLTIQLMLALVIVVLIYNLYRFVAVHMSSAWVATVAPAVHRRLIAFGLWMAIRHHRSWWHGSTRRSLAVGNRIRRVAFWQQFRFVCWDPFVRWLTRYGEG